MPRGGTNFFIPVVGASYGGNLSCTGVACEAVVSDLCATKHSGFPEESNGVVYQHAMGLEVICTGDLNCVRASKDKDFVSVRAIDRDIPLFVDRSGPVERSSNGTRLRER